MLTILVVASQSLKLIKLCTLYAYFQPPSSLELRFKQLLVKVKKQSAYERASKQRA